MKRSKSREDGSLSKKRKLFQRKGSFHRPKMPRFVRKGKRKSSEILVSRQKEIQIVTADVSSISNPTMANETMVFEGDKENYQVLNVPSSPKKRSLKSSFGLENIPSSPSKSNSLNKESSPNNDENGMKPRNPLRVLIDSIGERQRKKKQLLKEKKSSTVDLHRGITTPKRESPGSNKSSPRSDSERPISSPPVTPKESKKRNSAEVRPSTRPNYNLSEILVATKEGRSRSSSVFDLVENEFSIVYEPGDVPKAATLNSMLIWIITENQDDKYWTYFLLSFRHFKFTPFDIFKTLKEIYTAIPRQPFALDEIRLLWNQQRVIRFLFKMIRNTTAGELFEQQNGETSLAEQLLDFMKGMKIDGYQVQCRAFKVLISKIRNNELHHINLGFAKPYQSPATKLMYNLTRLHTHARKIDLSNYSASEIARHLMIIEFDLFRRININLELIDCQWGKPEYEKTSNVSHFIKRFNTVAFWVATEVVTSPTPKQQAQQIKKFIQIAEECKSLGNFNSLMEILAGLSSSAVSKLKEAWNILPEKYSEALKMLENLMTYQSNYKTYRAELLHLSKRENSFVLPYVGVYLKDLTFANENTNNLGNGLINFQKLKLLGSVLSDVLKYQEQESPEEAEDPQLYIYLSNLVTLDEETLYNCASFRRPSSPEVSRRPSFRLPENPPPL